MSEILEKQIEWKLPCKTIVSITPEELGRIKSKSGKIMRNGMACKLYCPNIKTKGNIYCCSSFIKKYKLAYEYTLVCGKKILIDLALWQELSSPYASTDSCDVLCPDEVISGNVNACKIFLEADNMENCYL